MKVLLIGLDYHSYTQAIADELRLMGHDVTRRNIRGSLTLFARALRIARPDEYARRLDAFHRSVLEEARAERPDWVLFVQCHWLSLETMRAFREALGDARFTLYNWDSVNTHDYRPYLSLFDDAYTFDIQDARELGLKYLPLFCMRQFQEMPLAPPSPPSLYHVGNIVNLKRYVAIHEVAAYCKARGIAFEAYMKVRPVIYYRIWQELGTPKGVSLLSIRPDQFRTIMLQSAATFDFANHAQSGHTMRVIENLCAGRKIVTNNRSVELEPFYSPDRFFLYEEGSYEGLAEFLAMPLRDPGERFPDYRVQRFASHLVEGTSHPIPGLAAPVPRSPSLANLA